MLSPSDRPPSFIYRTLSELRTLSALRQRSGRRAPRRAIYRLPATVFLLALCAFPLALRSTQAVGTLDPNSDPLTPGLSWLSEPRFYAYGPSVFYEILRSRNTRAMIPAPPVPLTGGGIMTAFGSALTEDFNSLANSGTNNVWINDSTIAGGYSNRATYDATAGTGTGAGLYSYGPAASSERALGSLASSSAVPVLGFKLTNNTGFPITAVLISYSGEQWRQGGSTAVTNTLAFSYQTAAPGVITGVTSGTWTNFAPLNFSNPI